MPPHFSRRSGRGDADRPSSQGRPRGESASRIALAGSDAVWCPTCFSLSDARQTEVYRTFALKLHHYPLARSLAVPNEVKQTFNHVAAYATNCSSTGSM